MLNDLIVNYVSIEKNVNFVRQLD